MPTRVGRSEVERENRKGAFQVWRALMLKTSPCDLSTKCGSTSCYLQPLTFDSQTQRPCSALALNLSSIKIHSASIGDPSPLNVVSVQPCQKVYPSYQNFTHHSPRSHVDQRPRFRWHRLYEISQITRYSSTSALTSSLVNLVSAAVVMNFAMPVSASGIIPSRALGCAHPLLTVLRGTPAAKDNEVTYEGEGITATKPAHDWIFSRWNLGGGNGFGNRVGAVSLLLTLMLVAYLILIAVHLLNSIRLKRLDEERAQLVAQGIQEPQSKLTKWWRSKMWMMRWKW